MQFRKLGWLYYYYYYFFYFFSIFFSASSLPPRRPPRSDRRQVRCPCPAGYFRAANFPGRQRRGAGSCAALRRARPGAAGRGCTSGGAGEPGGGLPPGRAPSSSSPLCLLVPRERVLFFPLFLPPFLLPPPPPPPFPPHPSPAWFVSLDHLSFLLPFVRVRDRTHFTLKSAASEDADARPPAPGTTASPLLAPRPCPGPGGFPQRPGRAGVTPQRPRGVWPEAVGCRAQGMRIAETCGQDGLEASPPIARASSACWAGPEKLGTRDVSPHRCVAMGWWWHRWPQGC